MKIEIVKTNIGTYEINEYDEQLIANFIKQNPHICLADTDEENIIIALSCLVENGDIDLDECAVYHVVNDFEYEWSEDEENTGRQILNKYKESKRDRKKHRNKKRKELTGGEIVQKMIADYMQK